MGTSVTNKDNYNGRKSGTWKQKELFFLVTYVLVFYAIIIRRSLQISHDHYKKLFGLRPGWLIPNHLNDVSDAQWRNFRGNLPVLTLVFGIFTLLANLMRAFFNLNVRGMSVVWLLFSFAYLSYLHGACVIFVLSIATINFLLVKIFARKKYFPLIIWSYNIFFLLCNRIYEGYSFSVFGQQWRFLDKYRGSFRWHICFNFVVLRMISFGLDYHWTNQDSHFDQEERSLHINKFGYVVYLSYLVYAPLYIAGPIVSFNAFASQLDVPQNSNSVRNVILYGFRWILCFILVEFMTHLFYYNAFANSGLWKHLSPLEVFIIGYGVLNFMWLKFLLIWRFFRFWSLVNGIDAPENMPKCINNCYSLEGFWKNWHASFNKWLVRYMYIPLGGSRKKLLNVWVIFTFVAIWHDLEWKLLSWAWLTCLFFIPELVLKSAAKAFQAESSFGEFIFRELSAVAGAVTITCLMVANLVGFVIGPSGINWLLSSFLRKEGLPVLGSLLMTFYVGTKIMFHIEEAKKRSP
ncbi:membrane-bound O-acyltransferase gup1-like isoform X2 [Trifolium pratense]|uniref:membrane-bound O-acyltransferase gup1-like isoform X2 n=1 Tax=Trifolium pratense TaxID=57577 RepID=UPI001E690512|nr:membrane-bound O-acyltransferase gup1-like isoform X2 [Trifolium pratense]